MSSQSTQSSAGDQASVVTPDSPIPTQITLGPGIELPENTSIETVKYLLELYFLWELPLHPVISRAAFLKHMAAGGGTYFSSLLLNVSHYPRRGLIAQHAQRLLYLCSPFSHLHVLCLIIQGKSSGELGKNLNLIRRLSCLSHSFFLL